MFRRDWGGRKKQKGRLNNKDSNSAVTNVKISLISFCLVTHTTIFYCYFCFDNFFYHLYFNEIHSENGEGQNIQSNFTTKTLKQSMPLNVKIRDIDTFIIIGEGFFVFVFCFF